MSTAELRDRLTKLLHDTPGACGLCVQVPDQPPLIEHNAGLRFPAASLIKLPIYYQYLLQCRSGELQPDAAVRLEKHHWVDGCGIMKEAEPGTKFRLGQIARYMLIHSDNVATNLMIDLLGIEPINATITRLGMAKSCLQRKMYDFESKAKGLDNWTTAGDVQTFLLGMLKPSPGDEQICAAVIETLKDQQINHKLPALLPKGAVLAHKTGELSGVEHNAGIIYGPEATVCVSALTMDLEENAHGVVFCQEVGRLVYSLIS